MTDPTDILRQFVPFDAMTEESLSRILPEVQRIDLKAGQVLFKQREKDSYSIYLLEGEVRLGTKEGSRQTVRSGTSQSSYALSALKPRQYTGIASKDVSVLRINTELIDKVISWESTTWETTDGIEVTEIDSDSDKSWMHHMIDTPAFLHLPTSNIGALYKALVEVPVKAGDEIVKQGEAGEYYYIIQSGTAHVSRINEQGKETSLAMLKKGDTFGEEALISGEPRNAGVTMKSDGVVIRLSRKHFNELLKAPLVKSVSPETALEMVRQKAVLIDTRFESEYRNNGNIRGSINIPLYMLRLKQDKLSRSKQYILYCDTGQRSSAATFLLGERGFDAYVLEGGLSALQMT